MTAVPPELTIVVPTFNERGNVAALAGRLDAALGAIAWEAIFVDDDSPDGTAEAVRALSAADPRIRCIRRIGRRGLSGACIEGMLAAQADVIAVIDADLQHDETVLPAMFRAIAGGAGIVVATRYAGGGEASSFSRARGVMSRLATRLSQRLLKVPSSDPMSGFFMVRRDLVESVAPKLSSQGFKILFDMLATLPADTRIAEVPYSFGSRHSGESKLDHGVVFDFASLLLAKATGGAISMRFVSFAVVGLAGLVVHLAALRLVLQFGASFPFAQGTATVTAMTFNFLVNNLLTYRDRRLRGWSLLPGLIRFYLVCGLGAFANVGLGSWVFMETSRWWVAGIAGSVVGALWNYFFSTTFVWKAKA